MTQNDANENGSSTRGRRAVVIAGIAVAASIVVVGIAFASRSSDLSPSTPTTDQQVASAWAQQNAQMWSWMGAHWDEMTAMHQHWGDTSWMQANLPDYAWMQDHWTDMSWMHEQWAGMMWMHTQGIMGNSPGGMMGR